MNLVIMSGNRESTSNSIKFAPMPLSALMATLRPLKKSPDSRDSSFSSADESDNSFGETSTKRPPNTIIDKELFTPKDKCLSKDIKIFTSEKKITYSDQDKENYSDNWVSNQTYPAKRKVIRSTPKNIHSNVYPSSEHKMRNILTPQHNNNSIPRNASVKKTPELSKVPNSGQKMKSATPKIKSGIRRFTPNSANLSHKKSVQKAVIQNRDKVRCELFTQKQKDELRQPPTGNEPIAQVSVPEPLSNKKPNFLQPSLPQAEPMAHVPVPETPLNKKPMSNSYAATPSYPQGVPNNQNSKILFKTISIKDKKYIFIKKLGVGGSSEVYKVLELGTSCEYAVKCVYLAIDQDLAQGYINEVRLLRKLQNSDRVIKLFDCEYDRTSQFLRMVLEVGETDLSSVLKARGAGLPPALVLHYWEEMLHAVHYIHEHGVIHADLKPANFLLVRGHLKLIDFGIASAISSDATSVVRSQATGTYSYISPEALMGGAGGYGVASADGSAPIKISFRSDVWSLGCILYSMVYGRTPFGHIPNLAKLAAILDPNHRIDYPPVEHLPPALLAALKWCLTYNARLRPSVRELLAIPYLQAQRQPLPQSLLDHLQPLVSPEQFSLLQRATL